MACVSKINGCEVKDKTARTLIQTETGKRGAADVELDRSIKNETISRANADAELARSIQKEATDRKSEIAVERARIDTLTSLPAGSTAGDAELADIRNGIDSVHYESAGAAVRGQFRQVAEMLEEKPDLTNLWTLGDQTFTRDSVVAFALPAGDYTFSAIAESTDTDSTACAVVFYNGDTKLNTLQVSPRGIKYKQDVTFAQDVTKVNFMASSDYPKSSGDTATITDITVIDRNAKIAGLTAKDQIAREVISQMNQDREMVQNPNLFDGLSVVGRYDYNTGKVYAGDSTAKRNLNPVILDPNKEYNVMLKTEYSTYNYSLNVWKYDENGEFISPYDGAGRGEIYHVSGASSINFSVSAYADNYPDEPLHIMVWESYEADEPYKEWLEYEEIGSYKQKKLNLSGAEFEKAMLSRDKARFDDSFMYIAYSAVTGSPGSINTAEHFTWAAKQGFNALKGDVRPTADGKLIMCHDAGFTLDEAGQIAGYDASSQVLIHDLTEEQCLALQHGSTQQHVCSFDKYLMICKKYGKIAYITIRDEYMDVVVPEMLAGLDKYNLRKRCVVNSFDLPSLQAVRAADSNIMLSQVQPSGLKIRMSSINTAIALGNCIITGFDFPSFGAFDDLDPNILQYARDNDIRLHQAQIDSMDDINRLMEYGIVGAHMTVVPEL